jgi:hypothetical protein
MKRKQKQKLMFYNGGCMNKKQRVARLKRLNAEKKVFKQVRKARTLLGLKHLLILNPIAPQEGLLKKIFSK